MRQGTIPLSISWQQENHKRICVLIFSTLCNSAVDSNCDKTHLLDNVFQKIVCLPLMQVSTERFTQILVL